MAGVALLGLTCRDRTVTGPGLPLRGRLVVAPTFQVAAPPDLDLAGVRAVVHAYDDGTHTPGDSIGTATATFVGGALANLGIDVDVTGSSQLFHVRLAAWDAAGDTLYRFADTIRAFPLSAPNQAPAHPVLLWDGADKNVTTLAIAPRDTALSASDTVRLRLTATEAGGAVVTKLYPTWVSRDDQGATVSKAGTAGAKLLQRSVWMVATLPNGVKDSTRVLVQGAIANVAIAAGTASIVRGDSTLATATLTDAGGTVLTGRAVAWSSSDLFAVAVTPAGWVKAVAANRSATITATSGGRSATMTFTTTPRPVASIGTSVSSVTLDIGQTVTVTATAFDAQGTPNGDHPITWTSLDATVAATAATASASAIDLTALKSGTTTLRASSGGVTQDVAVTVNTPPVLPPVVAAVGVSPQATSVVAGGAVQLTPSASDPQGQPIGGLTYTFASSDPSLATVTGGGLVQAAYTTALVPGSVQITVTESGSGKTATASITIGPVPASVVLVSPPTASIVEPATVQLSATAFDQFGAVLPGRAFAWSTGDASVASVSPSGLVTGTGGGSVTVSAASGPASGGATITVRAAVASVTHAAVPAIDALQGTTQLLPVARDRNGAAIPGVAFTYQSQTPAITSVNASGTVTGLANGAGSILVTAEGVQGTVAVPVQQKGFSLVITPGTPLLDAIDAQASLSAAVADRNGFAIAAPVVAWTALDPAIVDVTAAGVATARGAGTGRVQATSDAATATVNVLVQQAVASVTISPDTIKLAKAGDQGTFTGTALDRNGHAIVGAAVAYVSSNTNIVTVHPTTGVATLVALGEADVVASFGGFTATGHVVGKAGVVPIVGTTQLRVNPGTASAAVGETRAFTLQALDGQGNPLPVQLSPLWASSRPNKAVVDAAGVVHALDTGTVTITATLGGSAASATLTIGPGTRLITLVATPDTVRGVAQGARTVEYTFQTSDAGTGIGSVSLTLTDHAGQARTCVSQTPWLGSGTRGTWRCTFTIPAGAVSARQTWRVTQLVLNGTVTSTFDASGLLAAGFTAATLTVDP